MCKICQYLTPTQGISLVNSMIEDTDNQKDLIAFKEKYSHKSSLGTIGNGYWTGFMNHNRGKVSSSRGQKYELDRAL